MAGPNYYEVFDYDMINFESHRKETKCCKRYKKKGKSNCSDCPRLVKHQGSAGF